MKQCPTEDVPEINGSQVALNISMDLYIHALLCMADYYQESQSIGALTLQWQNRWWVTLNTPVFHSHIINASPHQVHTDMTCFIQCIPPSGPHRHDMFYANFWRIALMQLEGRKFIIPSFNPTPFIFHFFPSFSSKNQLGIVVVDHWSPSCTLKTQ